MASLIASDRWRDGGSISAVVFDGQQHRAFWLETNHWDHPKDAGHQNLFVSDGNDPELKKIRIEVGSTEERHWLDYLSRVDLSGVGEEAKRQFQTMIHVLRTRNSD